VIAAFRGVPSIDPGRFRVDLDRVAIQQRRDE
jgi:hypothetical protein